jgi:hypothetical protein
MKNTWTHSFAAFTRLFFSQIGVPKYSLSLIYIVFLFSFRVETLSTKCGSSRKPTGLTIKFLQNFFLHFLVIRGIFKPYNLPLPNRAEDWVQSHKNKQYATSYPGLIWHSARKTENEWKTGRNGRAEQPNKPWVRGWNNMPNIAYRERGLCAAWNATIRIETSLNKYLTS